MIEKKEIFKKIILVTVIFIVIVFSISFYKKENEEFIYYNIVEENVNEVEEKYENKVEEMFSKIKVYVAGEVNNPGVKELDEGARIEDAINNSGGLTNQADITNVNLAYPLKDGQKLYIPNINDVNKEEYISIDNKSGIIENVEFGDDIKVNINKATITELTQLPGVGESLAKRIIEYRNINGKFKSIEDLKNVSGIGEKKLENLREYIIIK